MARSSSSILMIILPCSRSILVDAEVLSSCVEIEDDRGVSSENEYATGCGIWLES
jgi:hypothetical protein